MNAFDSDLFRLIRLRDGVLPAADAAVFRERLAAEPRLRRLWKQICDTCEGLPWPESGDQNLTSDVDPESVAAFLEGRLEGDTQAFEGLDTRLREVIAIDRAIRPGAATGPEPPTEVCRRFESVLAEQLHQRSDSPRPVSVSSPHQSRGWRRIMVPGLVAAIVVLAAVAVWFRPQPPPVARGPRVAPTPAPSPVDRPPAVAPESPKTHEAPPKVVEDSPASIPAPPDPDGAIATEDKPPPEAPAEAPRVVLEWKRIAGLLAARGAEGGPWRDVAGDSRDAPGSPVPEIRSLGESWGEATTPSGLRVVVGQQAAVRLSVATEQPPVIAAAVLRGRFAIEGLPRDAALNLHLGEASYSLRVAADGTVVAVDPQESREGFLLLKGAVSHGDERWSGPQAIRPTDDGRLAARSFAKRLAWLERPPTMPGLSRRMAESLAGESNLLARLLRAGPTPDDAEAQLAATWGCDLDPVWTLPRAADSPVRGHRAAAIQWLSTANPNLAEAKAAVAALREKQAGYDLSPVAWFQAARAQGPPSIEIVQELGQGIGMQQPVFVRESAISMIRRLTGQRFSRYDAERPAQAAIAEVRQHLRQWISRFGTPQRGDPARGGR